MERSRGEGTSREGAGDSYLPSSQTEWAPATRATDRRISCGKDHTLMAHLFMFRRRR